MVIGDLFEVFLRSIIACNRALMVIVLWLLKQVSCDDCRFVELLWQLSLHALREVHRRTFPADVSSNPLPASLTDVAFSHAATLLPVTKVLLKPMFHYHKILDCAVTDVGFYIR